MVLKAVLLLLVFTVSQVIASSVLRLRSLGSLEILKSRQGTSCPVCTTVSNVVEDCTSVACICNADVATIVQDCVNCGLADNPSPTVISSAQGLIDAYTQACSGVAGVPTITRPAGIPAPSTVGPTPSFLPAGLF